VETIGSKQSYALTRCMPNNDDDDVCRKYTTEFGRLARKIWKNVPRKTVVPIDKQQYNLNSDNNYMECSNMHWFQYSLNNTVLVTF